MRDAECGKGAESNLFNLNLDGDEHWFLDILLHARARSKFERMNVLDFCLNIIFYKHFMIDW